MCGNALGDKLAGSTTEAADSPESGPDPAGGAMSSSPFTIDAVLSQSEWRELASRESDGLAVSLLWNPATDGVKVTVADSRLDSLFGGDFELHVPNADALSAFYHPFAFAAAEGMSFELAGRESLDLQPQV
jgi:hypothetical protein